MAVDEPPEGKKPPAAEPRKAATPWQWAQAPRHFVKATACGNARRHHAVTTKWDEVNCPVCLERAPFRRGKKE